MDGSGGMWKVAAQSHDAKPPDGAAHGYIRDWRRGRTERQPPGWEDGHTSPHLSHPSLSVSKHVDLTSRHVPRL